MPVLVIVFGPLHAVPIMAIAAILANLHRARADLVARGGLARRWRPTRITGVPDGGARRAEPCWCCRRALIECALGLFFLADDPGAALARRPRPPPALAAPAGPWRGDRLPHRHRRDYGPITAPIFLASGLLKGAFIAHRGRRLARGLREQDRGLPPLRRPAPAGHHAGPHHRRLAHGRRLDRQALRAPPRTPTASAS